MSKIWIITRRELASFFDSLIAYVMIILFLGLSGLFTWLVGSNVFLLNQASMQVFYSIAFWSLFFFIPAITMRMIAEENKAGTIELLITKAVSDSQIVWGKFFACLILVLIALVCTLPYYITISQLGNIDDGAVIGGYFALLLLSASYISIGLFASSLTQNQIVAFLIALFIGIFFQLLFNVLGGTLRGFFGELFLYLSMTSHFESMSRGVVDSRDLIYFGSIIAAGILASQVMLSKRNWQS
ncbi:ABC transporter permease [Marinoscillum furvescens]|uniref:ABC-2 type transport system permease protein n=1 Tax=Marinoscillum furvescens DSM 4134 TaxID=1122208 RepID=A0A3D9KYD2_MARFU|nr:ABC transporter permease subunit [Marinoscillum furvescens]RED93412.1 ABC-2 type transport system permease protein [Marinoscillum furvescens DSM 4134]